MEQTIGFLGAGEMGEALARGLLAAKVVSPDRILMSDADDRRLVHVAQSLGVHTSDDNAAVALGCDVVVVALRPAVVRQVLPTLAGALRGEKLVVSIAAGVTLAELEAMLRPGTRVVRVMPNAPCQVGRGASGFALGSAATPADRELVEEMLRAVGIAEEVAGDKELDAVTGLSGSGPAYVARVVEALAEGGVGAGLEEGVALRLAEQTVLGAAALMAEKSIRPDALWKKIATPGGTTIEGLKVLEEKGLRGALIGAVGAATKRASELAQGGKAKKGNP